METLSYAVPQLVSIAPVLLVYLVGVVLSWGHLRRLGRPAAFALAGCGMLFAISSVFPFLQGYIIASRAGQSMEEFSQWMSVLGLLRSLLYTMAFSLLLVAIFARRRAPARPGELGKTSGRPEWTDEIA